ncbi:MAG: hypothetical protein KDA85_12015 [Planctomycetaceae bacterium]|nr:hypothetical protein [Planctomycetaceae bacterium]
MNPENPYRPPVVIDDVAEAALPQAAVSLRPRGSLLGSAFKTSFRYAIVVMFNTVGAFLFGCALFNQWDLWPVGLAVGAGGSTLTLVISTVFLFFRDWMTGK